jgi:hypothetical protein
MSSTEPEKNTLYTFEVFEDKRFRGGSKLDAAYQTVLRRLRISPPPALDVARALRTYAAQFPLNIRWYDDAVKHEQKKRVALICVVITVAVSAIGGMLGLAVLSGSRGTVLTAQLGALISGVLLCLQLLTSVTDFKARFAVFWKARSELKEALYTFEDKWKGRVEDKTLAEFQKDLREELAKARMIGAQEQEAFFATLKSPGEILTTAMTAFDQVKSSVGNVIAKVAEKTAGKVARQEAAQKAYDEAVGLQAGCERRVAQLVTMQKPDELEKAKLKLVEAQVAVAQARSQLDAARGN